MRMHLAGVEMCMNGIKFNIPFHKDTLVLVSFYHCSEQTMNCLKSKVDAENILLDSGAFTFRTKGLKGTNIDDYTTNYINFINKFNIDKFFEMDIDMTAEELPKVKQLRDRIEKETGKKCIPVWHKTRGVEEWKELVENYDYIAIGGITSALDKRYAEMIKKLVAYANSKGVKVHGLGYNRRDLLDFGFYSVDATSWQGIRYGTVWTWDEERQVPVQKMPKHFGKDRVKTDRQVDVTKNNYEIWYKYQKIIKHKGYWRE